MNLSLIAAIGRNNELGINGKMPWHYPEDMRWFRMNTIGHPILMGRKTYESTGRLPGRLNMILSQSMLKPPDHCLLFKTLEHVFEVVQNERTYVIGGAEIYQQTLLHANELILTEIDKEFEADTFFPCIDYYEWDLVFSHQQGDLTFKKYNRK